MRVIPENLAVLYRGDSTLQKSETPVLEKGGEGSRGGKVIGHTKSVKPIYAGQHASEYKNFSKEDHEDAYRKHQEEAEDIEENHENEEEAIKAVDHHKDMAMSHERHADPDGDDDDY